jgi:hypothetical protein
MYKIMLYIGQISYHMNIVLGDFSAKVGVKDIFRLAIGNESSHKVSMIMGLE